MIVDNSIAVIIANIHSFSFSAIDCWWANFNNTTSVFVHTIVNAMRTSKISSLPYY